jgi:peptide chain release factor subunit 1
MSTLWESIEERERRVRGSRTTSIMARAAEQVPDGKTLREAFAQRPFINREDLRSIAGGSYDRPVLTLYLNFTPDRLVRADRPVFLSVFSSLRHQALESNKEYIDSLPHAQRLQVPEDLREIQDFLEGYQPQGARALVILKSGEQLNRVMPLPVRVADHLTIGGDPYIQPLEAILEEEQRALIVDVARHTTAVSIYELGFELPIDKTVEDLPRETHEAFREGKTERHRETHVVWHFKASAQLADRVFREAACDVAILIGEQITVDEFEDYLPKALHQRLIGRLHLDREAPPNQRRAAIEGVMNEQRKRDEEASLEELGFFQGHDRLAAGVELVLNAANLFLMRQLFVRDDMTGTGFICHAHNFLSLKPGACPFDEQPLQPADNLVDELIEMARLHGVEVMLVSQRKDLLDPYEGIAAVLVAPTPIEQLRAVAVTS